MTDKEEIIIDAVNVGQCKYLNTFTDCDGYHYYCDLADDIKNEYCEYYKDCYFKQLQQEKFENLNNRQMVESAENLIYENSELIKNLKEKEQECEELKGQINKVKDYVKHNMQDVDCDNWLERFIYTFEDWKKSLQNDTDRYKQTLDEIEKELKEDVYCESQECGCDDFEECLKCTKEYILDIISRAKDCQ